MKKLLLMLFVIAAVSFGSAAFKNHSGTGFYIIKDTVPKKQYFQVLKLGIGEWQRNIDTLLFVGQSIGRSKTADEADTYQRWFSSVIGRMNQQMRIDSITIKSK